MPFEGMQGIQLTHIIRHADIDDSAVFACGLSDNIGQTRYRTGPKNKINVGQSPEHVAALLLSHTSSDTNDQVGAFSLENGKSSQETEDLLFGLFSNGAGIHYDKIRPFENRRWFISQWVQEPLDLIGVIYIHLTSDGVDIASFGGH
jgi:hypothetical protein